MRAAKAKPLCPVCGSQDVSKAPPEAYRSIPIVFGLFVVRYPLRCQTCGALFEPPSRVAMTGAAIVGGVALLTVFLDLLPDIRVARDDGMWHALPGILVDMLVIVGSVWIAIRLLWSSRS